MVLPFAIGFGVIGVIMTALALGVHRRLKQGNTTRTERAFSASVFTASSTPRDPSEEMSMSFGFTGSSAASNFGSNASFGHKIPNETSSSAGEDADAGKTEGNLHLTHSLSRKGVLNTHL
jgi:hypothetical protein